MLEIWLQRFFLRFMAKLFPLPPGYEEAGPPLEKLAPVYRKWLSVVNVMCLPYMALLTFVWWYYILAPLCRWNASRFDQVVFHLYLPAVAMAAPAIFLGILSSAPLVVLTIRGLLRDRFALFLRYDNLFYGIDFHRAMRLLLSFFGLILLAAVLAILNWHMDFDQKEVRLQSWFGLSHSAYPYSAVAEIRTAPRYKQLFGKVIEDRGYEIQFSDGVILGNTWERP